MKKSKFCRVCRVSLLSPHIYARKKIYFCSGTGVIQFCLSVCPSVCPCVRVSLQKSAVTFKDGSAQNFQGLLYSSQVIFGRVPWGPRGQARTLKKRVFAKSISSGGFGAGGSCHIFLESEQQGKQNVGSGIVIFGCFGLHIKFYGLKVLQLHKNLTFWQSYENVHLECKN